MSHNDRRLFLQHVTALLGTVSVSACGGGGGDDGAEPEPGAPAPSPAPAQPGPAAPPAPAPAPPSTPVPASGTASFTLENPGAAGEKKFCLGQAFKAGEIAAGSGVVCDLPDFQASVLNRWPDGSVKFALLAGKATLAAGASQTYALRAGTAAGGSAVAESVLSAAQLGAELAFEPVGRVALQPLIGVASSFASASGRFTPGRVRQLIAGPQMSAWVYYSPIASHAHLCAWFEVRCWADGAAEVLPWLENGWWNVAGPTSHAGTLSFSLGGSQRMAAAITLPHHCRAAAIGSEPAPWRSGGEWAQTRHDGVYLQDTGLVPSYFAQATEAAIARQVTAYAPLDKAGMPATMGSGGYSSAIGLLPEWDVVYLTSGADLRAQRSVLANALAHGRWAVHYRDEKTNRPVSMTAYPTRVLHNSGGLAGVASIGASAAKDYTPQVSGVAPPSWASTHHCSAGYVAYLVSGWNYFIEETQFVASTCGYKLGDTPRQGAQCLFRPDHTPPRGVAWANRTLAQCVALTPDDDTVRAAYVSALEANIAFNHATYVAQPNNKFGLMAPYGDGYTPGAKGTTVAGSTATVVLLAGNAQARDDEYLGWTLTIGGQDRTITAYTGATKAATVDRPFTVATAGASFVVSDWMNVVPMWMEDFMTGAFGYQLALNLPISTTARTRLAEFFAWKAQSVVGRFGTPGRSDEFHYCDAAQYTLAAAPTDTPDFNGGTGPWYANWGQIYEATLGKPNVATAGDQLRGGYFPSAISYWGNLQPALAYAVTHGAAGAAAAHARMAGDPQWNTFLANGNADPVWSVQPAR